MNALDRIIGWVSPSTGIKRHHARRALAYYEAARPDRLRKFRNDRTDGSAAVLVAGDKLRIQARHLDQNHDLARGILNTLVVNIVGPCGIQVEPHPLSVSGEVHDDFAKQLTFLWKNWQRYPDVTWEHDWPSLQRLACRSWLRDGEVFAQLVAGVRPDINHGTLVPLSLELIEADLVPMTHDLNMGIVRDTWGRPSKYIVYYSHPGGLNPDPTQKWISAQDMIHLKYTDRIGQVRGVSILASVLTRLDDIKDYEESERVAAKVAASMAAVIKKGTPDMYALDSVDGTPRTIKFRPGMVFDDLMPGESVETIDTKRPNSGLGEFRKSQLRAVASGVGVSYSSAARDYNGTYSAQRQELVEQYAHYECLQAQFSSRFVRPVWDRFVTTAVASGALKLPPDVDVRTILDAEFRGPVLPWIDPEREVNAQILAINEGLISRKQVMRDRGEDPNETLHQIIREQPDFEAIGIKLGMNNVPNIAGQIQQTA